MKEKECLNHYFSLMQQRPQLFEDSDIISIVKDRNLIESFINETGARIGVIYRSKYNCWVVDLVYDQKGNLYTYERVIPAANGRGIVCIPIYKGNYILLKQYRHAIRNTQICFPRGYGENCISSHDNTIKEIYEEIGATINKIYKIGEISADSGLSSGIADIYVCDVESYSADRCDEGILEMVLYSHNALKKMIEQGEINDGFTLGAFAMLECRGEWFSTLYPE